MQFRGVCVGELGSKMGLQRSVRCMQVSQYDVEEELAVSGVSSSHTRGMRARLERMGGAVVRADDGKVEWRDPEKTT